MKSKQSEEVKKVSRRNFIKASTAISLGILARPANAFFGGSDELRVGLIGCGYRGTNATSQILSAKGPIKLWAMADLFRDKLDTSYNTLLNGSDRRYDCEPFGSMKDKMNVPYERQFVGFDAYKKLLTTDVNVVILASMPQFYPQHFKAAVEADKHVFIEKPAAVDPVGIRSIIETSRLAGEKKLTVVAGTQRRHQDYYLEIMKRIHDGAIGEILNAQCCWLAAGGTNWPIPRQDGWSDVEWQIRNWRMLTWLSGDHIVEQHLHNLDVINWALGSHPVRCLAIGGRELRKDENSGNVFDHFAVEYEYPNGVRLASMCSQKDGTTHRIAERLVGTKATAQFDMSRGLIVRKGIIEGDKPYSYKGPPKSPYQQEMDDLVESVRNGEGLNEGVQLAESTLTAIMGRMSAYTGRALKWDWVMNSSRLDLSPATYQLGDLPIRPAAIPGKTKLV